MAAWAEVGNGSAGYRTAAVTRADIGTTLDVVGDVEPVSDAASSFQVAGQVASISVAPGQVVTAGQTLGTLDTTALSESVSSAQSTVAADEAKLVEDEESETSSSASALGLQGPDLDPVVDHHNHHHALAIAWDDEWPERHCHLRPEHADQRRVDPEDRPEQRGGRPGAGPE